MHIRVTVKVINYFISPYNNVGLSSKGYEDMCTRNDKKCIFIDPTVI